MLGEATLDTLGTFLGEAIRRLSLIDVRPVVSLVLDAVIDAAHVIGRVQALPGVRFVGMDDGAGGDVLAYQRHRLTLARHNERPGAAHNFAGDNHDRSPTCLFLSEPTVNAIGLLVCRFHIAARVHAVNFYRAGKLGFIRL